VSARPLTHARVGSSSAPPRTHSCNVQKQMRALAHLLVLMLCASRVQLAMYITILCAGTIQLRAFARPPTHSVRQQGTTPLHTHGVYKRAGRTPAQGTKPLQSFMMCAGTESYARRARSRSHMHAAAGHRHCTYSWYVQKQVHALAHLLTHSYVQQQGAFSTLPVPLHAAMSCAGAGACVCTPAIPCTQPRYVHTVACVFMPAHALMYVAKAPCPCTRSRDV
jgi:hypothetical protein